MTNKEKLNNLKVTMELLNEQYQFTNHNDLELKKNIQKAHETINELTQIISTYLDSCKLK